MKYIVTAFLFIFRLTIALLTWGLTWLLCFLAFGIPFFTSMWAGLAAAAVTFFGLKWGFDRKVLQESGLSRREYKYIQEQIKEAKVKIGRLQKVMFSVGNVMTIKQNFDVLKVAKKIQGIVESEPRRFYEAEQFYYSHLDSIVELTEKYAFLTKQPVKTKEIQDSLHETRATISEIVDLIEHDLFKILNSDMDELRIELDVAKQNIDKNKNLKS